MKFKFILILGAAAMLFSSCEKWLNEVKPADGSLSPDIMFTTEVGVQNAMTGAYDLLKDFYGGRTSCLGYKSFILMYEYRGPDLNARGDSKGWPYGFANDFVGSSGASANNGYEASFPWTMFYEVINNFNAIIEGVQKSPLSQELKDSYIAEATAMRGWCYFQVSRSYQYSYNYVEKTAPCVPIYTEQATGASKGKARSTVAEVYAHILSDLSDEVIAKINAKKPAGKAYRINQDVAYAFRAQVKLEMSDWAGAAADAEKAIGTNSSKYPLMTVDQYQSGFNTFNQEWMWGMPFRPDQAFNFDSFFAMTDYMAHGYQCFFPNSEYYKLFTPTDMRRELMPLAKDLTKGTPLAINPLPTDPMYYLSTKFLARGTQFDGDYIFMRASEMVLIQAECKAQLGQSGDAQALLFMIQHRADPEAEMSTNTGQALVDEILVERRKEFQGEIGASYYDLRRYNKPLTHVGNAPYAAELAPGGDLWLLQIPKKEMDNNKLMVQNPRS